MSDFITAGGSVFGALQADKAAEDNAQMAELNAFLAIKQSKEDARRIGVLASKVISAQRAAYGASGVTLEGSPLDVIEESAANAELDILTAKQQGKAAAFGLSQQAEQYRAEGRTAKTLGFINAGASAFSGAEKIAFGGG